MTTTVGQSQPQGNPQANAQAAPAAPQANIVGGPLDPMKAPESTASPAVQSPAQQAQASAPAISSKPLMIGNRIFNTAEEAIAYADSIERERTIRELHNQAPAQAAPTPATQTRVDPADILFDDPKAAIRLLKEQIKEESSAETNKQKTNEQVWKGFYDKNPDLQGFEDIVELQKSKHWASIRDVPVDQALPWLAREARSYLSKIRGTPSQVEQLQGGPAMVAGSSGAAPPSVPMAVNKPTTFMDEMAEFKNRRKAK